MSVYFFFYLAEPEEFLLTYTTKKMWIAIFSSSKGCSSVTRDGERGHTRVDMGSCGPTDNHYTPRMAHGRRIWV